MKKVTANECRLHTKEAEPRTNSLQCVIHLLKRTYINSDPKTTSKPGKESRRTNLQKVKMPHVVVDGTAHTSQHNNNLRKRRKMTSCPFTSFVPVVPYRRCTAMTATVTLCNDITCLSRSHTASRYSGAGHVFVKKNYF